MILSMLRGLAGVALAVALLPIDAQAQTVVFPDLASHIRSGDRVSLTDRDGTRVEGEVADLTASSLTLLLDASATKRVFPEATVSRIVVKDSLRNGALIGLAAGALPGAILGVYATSLCEGDDGCAVLLPVVGGAFYGGIGAAIGAGIDALIKKTIDVSRQPRASVTLAPVFGPNQQGIRVSIRF